MTAAGCYQSDEAGCIQVRVQWSLRSADGLRHQGSVADIGQIDVGEGGGNGGGEGAGAGLLGRGSVARWRRPTGASLVPVMVTTKVCGVGPAVVIVDLERYR